MICFICRGRHLFLGDNNVTSRVFRIPVDPGLAGLVANVWPISLCVSYWILTGLWLWILFSVLDINSRLASRCVTSTVCWRQWCAVNMVLTTIDEDVDC